MAFTPSYNILDKDTHNTLVEALKSGGIGYTEADGTVHKISDTYASGSGSSLPEVSADDNGDVLTVVSGEWAKAAPSGGGGSESADFTDIDTTVTVTWGDDGHGEYYTTSEIPLATGWEYDTTTYDGIYPTVGIISITVNNEEHTFYPYDTLSHDPPTSIDGYLTVKVYPSQDDAVVTGAYIEEITINDVLGIAPSTSVGVKALVAVPNARTYAIKGMVTGA